MRKAFIVCLIILFMISWVVPGYCNGPMRKLERGMCNLLTFYFEIYNQIQKTDEKDGMAKAVTSGFLQGIFMTVARVAVGLYETVTFPFPVPKGYEPILKDPEFFCGSPD